MGADRADVQDEPPPRGQPPFDQRGVVGEPVGRELRTGPGTEDDDRSVSDRKPLANRTGGGMARCGDERRLATGEPGLGVPAEPVGSPPEPLLGDRFHDRIVDDEADPDARRHRHERVVRGKEHGVEPGEGASHARHLA